MLPYIQWAVVIRSSTADLDFEQSIIESKLRKLFGFNNGLGPVTLIQILPEGYNPGDQIPDPDNPDGI